MSRSTVNRGAEWKTLRFTHLVQESISIALGSCGDPLLSSLSVESVDPAPDAGRLLVTVSFTVDPIPDPRKTLERLLAATGWLRGEIAGSISRKRVPELTFRFSPDGRR